MLFVAFCALVLVPILTGLDPNVALFTAGAGTLVFQLVTRGKVPLFLASSFAFIAPIHVGVQRLGVSATLSGLVAAGLLYVALAALIRARGIEAFERLLPPVVTAPVIMVIGLSLAPAIEHFGDVLAIRGVTGKDYLADPGVDRTMLGDGLAAGLAGMVGGPPDTTYSEVTGAVALTRAFSPAVMTIAAVTAIVLAFVGKLGAFLQTIPGPVMGGILVILFGGIVVVGMNALVRAGTDLTAPRNLVIASVILVFGVGGMLFEVGDVRLEGIGLAGLAGVPLNAVLPHEHASADPT